MVLHNICINERDELIPSDDSDSDQEEIERGQRNHGQERSASASEDRDDELEMILPIGDDDIRTSHKADAYREHITSIL